MNEEEFAEFLESGSLPRTGPDDGAMRPAEDVRALLADPGVWAEPDPGGADALLAIIRRTVAAETPLVTPGPLTAVPGDRGPQHLGTARPRLGGRRLVPVLAAAAVLVLVVGVVGAVFADRGGDQGNGFAIEGTELAPSASATAMVDDLPAGASIRLDVRGLPPAQPGTFYEAWVKGDAGAVTVGTFHMRGGDDWVYLWSGVDLARYPTLAVTLEKEDNDQSSSGQVVLTGRIA